MNVKELGKNKSKKGKSGKRGRRKKKKLWKCNFKIEEAKLIQAEVNVQLSSNKNGQKTLNNSSRSGKSLKVPAFVEGKGQYGRFLLRFERYASTQNWDVRVWAVNLRTLLTGKGLLVYYGLSDSDFSNYAKLEDA
ncbi:hypothetical protein HOLleu_02033 [Holothuria leucospilota]|uniref:Uncharacterized protein n=1 Tax=Holothuria leucospilota TaxID=206669 RepID=A0A9Q1HL77_HOLLE|nr:hypothetical protein HOLleu_02033 [Holothuria leucospilota]